MDVLWRRLMKGKAENMEGRQVVTLIGANLAKEGEEFIFWGASKRCEECRLKNSCTNLEVGRRYRVVKVRNEIKHDCYIHEGGVCVVEVTESTIQAAINSSRAFKNSKIVFEPAHCEETTCTLFDSCHPAGLRAGDRCTILEILGDLPDECADGRALKLVAIHREAL